GPNQSILVSPGRIYPQGLGYGPNGFSLEEGIRVAIPLTAFAVWHCRQEEIPGQLAPDAYIIDRMKTDLNLAPSEVECLFISDSMQIGFQNTRLSDSVVYKEVSNFLDSQQLMEPELIHEQYTQYTQRVRSMVTVSDAPAWVMGDPDERVT